MPVDEAFIAFPTLTTRRLLLRQISREDTAGIFAFKSNPDVTGRYGREPHASLAHTAAWIEGILANYERRESLLWVIEPKPELQAQAASLPRLAGSVVLWNFDEEIRCVELGYELHPATWGQGLASEACLAILEYAFNRMEVNRIEACPLAGNPASSRLLEKLGFTYEGRLRERVFHRGGYSDMLYYGLLREEWQAQNPGAH